MEFEMRCNWFKYFDAFVLPYFVDHFTEAY